MEDSIIGWMFVAEIALLGLIGFFLPRIGRRGLLFGVYVGEAAHDAEVSRAIRGRWQRSIVISTVVCLVASAAVVVAGGHPLLALAPELLWVAIASTLYVRCHRAAREVARTNAPLSYEPPAAASLMVAGRATVLPWITLLAAVVCGMYAVGEAAAHFGALPDRVPVHFNITGEADRWAPRSFGSVMILPVMTVVMGLVIGGLALLTANAKRALRAGDRGASLAAQQRFRTAMARYLSVTGILMVLLLGSLSSFSLRVARGLAPGIPRWFGLEAIAFVVCVLSGIAYVFVRYGQGGARLEGATSAPLTNGLADNRRWKLGMLYVDRDDPSWLVEKRFGLGYTLNLGNPRALAAFGGLLALILGLAIWAIESS